MISCTSSFGVGQEASHQKADMQGRPGINPLRFRTIYDVTPEQLGVVRQMADALGIERKRRAAVLGGYDFDPDSPDIVPLNGMWFRAAERPAVHMKADPGDLDALARWVREGRHAADIVVASVHTHEHGGDEETPAQFLTEFAHRMIDEGADVVVAHGPHMLRGLELYRGKPIFHSLGNFIRQSELVPRLPHTSFERFRVDPASTPGEVYRVRSESKGAPPDRRLWETVVPICVFEGRALAGITMHPVSLGFGEPRPHRGRPRLAVGDLGGQILDRFAVLSAGFGTRLSIADGTARLD
jgi:poly-gamma-glutamate synthesis protein (capsule biosynthesis protein)